MVLDALSQWNLLHFSQIIEHLSMRMMQSVDLATTLLWNGFIGKASSSVWSLGVYYYYYKQFLYRMSISIYIYIVINIRPVLKEKKEIKQTKISNKYEL